MLKEDKDLGELVDEGKKTVDSLLEMEETEYEHRRRGRESEKFYLPFDLFSKKGIDISHESPFERLRVL
jgi:hypothetical protein